MLHVVSLLQLNHGVPGVVGDIIDKDFERRLYFIMWVKFNLGSDEVAIDMKCLQTVCVCSNPFIICPKTHLSGRRLYIT